MAVPARRLKCPSCGWSAQTFIDPDQFPVNCPKCGCPIWRYAQVAKSIRWKVYLFDDPAVHVVVEWPSYDLDEILKKAVETSDRFNSSDLRSLSVRRHSAEVGPR